MFHDGSFRTIKVREYVTGLTLAKSEVMGFDEMPSDSAVADGFNAFVYASFIDWRFVKCTNASYVLSLSRFVQRKKNNA